MLDLYLAGSDYAKGNDHKILPHNTLLSYGYQIKAINDLCEKKRIKDDGSKLFIDSGAYSAWTHGKIIDEDAYIDFVNSKGDLVDLIAQVDCIPGDKIYGATREEVLAAAEQTWKNYLYMRPKMKYPKRLLYTFHVGEPVSFLKRALEWKDDEGNYIPYIAFGGMVGKSTAIRRDFLTLCFDTIKNSSNPNVKVHAFGMTTFKLLDKFPISSADSTSWIMTGAMGGIITDWGVILVSDKAENNMTHYKNLSPAYREKVTKLIIDSGYTLEELGRSGAMRFQFNADYLIRKVKKLKYNPAKKINRLF